MPTLPPNHQRPHVGNRRQHRSHAEQWGQGRGGRPWERLRERVFMRDKFLCQPHLRKGELVPVELHGSNAGICDHVIPLAEGGLTRMDNLECSCKGCSATKTAQEAQRAKGFTTSQDPSR